MREVGARQRSVGGEMALRVVDACKVGRARRLAALDHALGDFVQVRMRGNHRNSFAWGGERAIDAGLNGRGGQVDFVFETFSATTTILVEKLHTFHLENPNFGLKSSVMAYFEYLLRLLNGL